MSLSPTHVTVGTTPTLIANPGSNRSMDDPMWVDLYVASGGQTIYLGDANVTTSNGRAVVTDSSWSATLASGDALYAVVAATTQVVHVLKSRQ